MRGISTGIREYTAAIEVRNLQPVLVTAETFPIAPFVDTPKVCLPVTTPETVVPVVALHEMSCVKENAFTVQVHYFVWSDDPTDPDHIESPALATPTAELAWRLDLVPLSYKTALIPPGHWQVWFHPAVAPPVGYNIKFTVDTTVPGQGFYYDFLGHRGCPFYVEIAPGVNDQDLLGCPNDYEA